MQISFNPYLKLNNTRKRDFRTSYPNLAPLQRDTVTFGAMKKSKFSGIDRAVVENFKAPIEKFYTNADLQKWSFENALELANKDYGGRKEETKIQRKAMLKEWSDYVLQENDGYTNAMSLLILDAVTKDLKPDNDTIPPVLNKGVLADCIAELEKNTKEDPKYQFDLNKIYKTKLQSYYLDDTQNSTGETSTKWVKIPSKSHDPEHFDENVEKLKTLSYKSWCTKSFKAEPYLEEGDFHIYLENGQPKVGVRFVNDKIQEIQGEANNGKVPLKYLSTVEEHIKEDDLRLTSNVRSEIQDAKELEKEVIRIKSDLKEAIESNDAARIYEYFGVEVEADKSGLLTISEYRQPLFGLTYSDADIDEKKLFERVKTIKGNADFSDSQVRDLGNLESIGGLTRFENSQVRDLGNLESIGKNAYFTNSQITNLGNLESIGGFAFFENSQVRDLGNLKSIGGNAYFANSQVRDLGNLESIGGFADFANSQVRDLGNLESIGRYAEFRYSQVIDLGHLKSIGGYADFGNSQVRDLGNLESIGGNAYFANSQITNLGNLESIGRDADFGNSQVTDLGNLQSIGGYANFKNSQVTDLGNLQSIGGYANFKNSQVTNLGNLQSIGGDADFSKSKIRDFGNLRIVGGEVSYNTPAMKQLLEKRGLI